MMKTILKYKYFLLLLLIVIGLIVLYINGKKSIHHEIYINASTENVFAILMDTDNYDEWNPVLRAIEGEMKEGRTITYQYIFDPENIHESTFKVKEIVPNKLINQTGGIPLILTFDHKYILEKDIIGTKLTIREDCHGIGANFISTIQSGISYSKLASALEVKAES